MHLIVNERREAGASLPHTHAQLYALDFVPAAVARERERFGAYADAHDGRQPARRPRAGGGPPRASAIVAIDDEAVLLAPVRRRALPFQLHARAAPPAARASRTTGRPAPRCCTTALRRLARRLGASPPLNLWVRTAPRGAEHFCWRIDILPRLAHLAGLELGTGVHLNIVAARATRPPSCARRVIAVAAAIVARSVASASGRSTGSAGGRRRCGAHRC